MSSSPSELIAPLIARGVNLSLDAMRAALRASGDPHLAIPCVHIAGTNGKGSVAAIVHEALCRSGIRAARYTSPHLHRVAERFVVGTSPVDEAPLCDELLRVRRERDAAILPPMSLFETLTLVAWRLFARLDAEIAVIEVGVGGRLDATNLCAPRATAITRIAFDHTHWLGDSLGAIAREKAGICKPQVPCVLGAGLRSGEAREAIAEVAGRVGAPVIDAPVAVLHDGGRARWPFGASHVEARPALAGDHQIENASVAVALCELLRRGGVDLRADELRGAVEGVTWPGRMERIGDVLLDAAHNEDGLRALGEALRAQRVGAVVFGASRDKDLASMTARLRALCPPSRIIVTMAATERAADAHELARSLGAEACASPTEALALARARCAPGEVIVVCGSIFVVAEVRASLLGIEAEPLLSAG